MSSSRTTVVISRAASCRAMRTRAAVPTTATAAPAPMVASRLPTRRAASAWWPLTCSSSRPRTVGLSYVGLQPAARSRLLDTTQGCTTYCRSLAGAGMMPSRCRRSAVPKASAAGSSMRRSPETSSTSSCSIQPSQPTVATPVTCSEAASSSAVSRSSTWQNCQRGWLSRTTSSRGASKCRVSTLSTPGPTTVAGRSTVTCRPGWLRGACRAKPLDLQPVREQAAVGHGAQRGVVVERHRVVRQRAVDHGRGAEHHATDAAGSSRGEHGLRAADVALPAGLGVAVEGGVDGEVDDRVHRREPAGQAGIGDVEDPPGDPRHDPAALVETDHLRHVGPLHEPLRKGRTETVGGAGDGDDRRLRPAAAPRANGRLGVAVAGTHRAAALVGQVATVDGTVRCSARWSWGAPHSGHGAPILP